MYPWEHMETQEQAAPIGLAQPLADSAEEAAELSAPANCAARVFNGQIALLWQASGGAEGYLVLRGETAAQLKPIAAVEETGYTDAAAKPGKAYYYAVRAYNENGQSGTPQAVRIVLPEHVEKPKKEPAVDPAEKKDAPAPPKELRAAARGTRLAALTWQDGADEESADNLDMDERGDTEYHDPQYRLYRSAAPWCGYTLIAETKETSYLDTVPEAVTKYYYFVQAVRGGQASKPSAMAEVFTFPPLPAPEPPQNLRAMPTPAGDAVELQWKRGKAAAAYVVYAREEGQEFKVAGFTLEQSFLHEAPPDTPMEYRVQSYHDTGVSEPSAICALRTRKPQQRPPRFPAFKL